MLILEAISGNVPKKARLELLLDDGYWPSFSTERSRSQSALWDQVGEGFVRELDFCSVWLRLNENEEGIKDDIVGEIRMSALAFLDRCWVRSLFEDSWGTLLSIRPSEQRSKFRPHEQPWRKSCDRELVGQILPCPRATRAQGEH